MDDLGSVLKVVDSSGTVENSYYYDPCGLTLNKNETVSNPWQYASGYYDANTGLYKFGTRYYDTQTGRWTQKDPVGGSVGKIGSGNPYVYAGDEPTMQVDPSGRECIFDALVAAAGGIFAALSRAGYLAALLQLAAGPTVETTVLAFLFSLTAPSVLGSIIIAGGIFIAAVAIEQAIVECSR